jgi:hypothetical protein
MAESILVLGAFSYMGVRQKIFIGLRAFAGNFRCVGADGELMEPNILALIDSPRPKT